MSLQVEQTPQEEVTYTINWPSRGLPTGVTISTSSFSASDPSIVLTNMAIVGTATQTQFTLSGGVAQNIYQITNTVGLSTGDEWSETISYFCNAQNLS